MRPSFASTFALHRRGRREDRMRAAPAVSCAKSHKNTHTSIQVQRRTPGLPCAMVLRLIRGLPGEASSIATIAGGILPANLTPAFGRRNHTTSPSANLRSSFATPRPPHPTPRFVTCATPLSSDETGGVVEVIWATGEAKYF